MSVAEQEIIVDTNNSINEDDNNLPKSNAIENNTLVKEAIIFTATEAKKQNGINNINNDGDNDSNNLNNKTENNNSNNETNDSELIKDETINSNGNGESKLTNGQTLGKSETVITTDTTIYNKKDIENKVESNTVENKSESSSLENNKIEDNKTKDINNKNEPTIETIKINDDIKTTKTNVEEVSETEKTKSKTEESQNIEKKTPTKHVLPKWMVEDADAPPSPDESEQNNVIKTKANDTVTPPSGGRGRKGRAAAATTNTPVSISVTSKRLSRELQGLGSAGSSKSVEEEKELGFSQRPRRSTRTRIDYANPDAATVIAEVDDEEPRGLSVTRKGFRGRAFGTGVGRGKKRGANGKKRKNGDSSEDDLDEDDDAGSDYGSLKKKKSARVTAVKFSNEESAGRGRRGRPAGNSKAGKDNVRGRYNLKKKNYKESDDEDEIQYDDRESNEEESPLDDEDDLLHSKSTPVKRNKPPRAPVDED